MPRTAATYTQADISRAVRALRQATGREVAVTLTKAGDILVVPMDAAAPPSLTEAANKDPDTSGDVDWSLP